MDYERAESGQRELHELNVYQSKISAAVLEEELTRFKILKPKIYIDGNQWCVLYGENIQDGVCGFGDTPDKAIWDWNKQWDKSLV